MTSSILQRALLALLLLAGQAVGALCGVEHLHEALASASGPDGASGLGSESAAAEHPPGHDGAGVFHGQCHGCQLLGAGVIPASDLAAAIAPWDRVGVPLDGGIERALASRTRHRLARGPPSFPG